MKKIFSAIIVVLVTALGARAQDSSNVYHGHKKRENDQLIKQLNLSTEQMEKLKSAQADYKKRLAELKQNDSMTTEQRKSQKASIMKEQHETLQQILTPEQKEKYKSLRKEEAANRTKENEKRQDKVKNELGLTDAQVAKLHAANSEFKANMSKIKNDTSLNENAKKEQSEALRKHHEEELKSILTPAQFEKIHSLHQRGKENEGV
jgi:Spy/CpxP family protein refolding chaperone